MSNNNEKILFTVEVDEGQTEKRINTLRANVAQLTKEKKELEAANKAGTINAQQYANAISGVDKALKANQAELRDQTRMLDLSQKATQAATGSNNQLRAQLSLLAPQYNALSKEGRETTAAGKALQAQIREITDELKGNEKAVGDNRRNVGNYVDSVQEAERGLGLFGGALGNMREKLAGAKTGLESMKLGLTGVKGVIAATGVGALLLLLTALYALFTRTQAGADKMAQGMAAVGAVVNVLINRGVTLTRAFVDLFTKPRQALEEFKAAFAGIGDEMAKAVDAAVEVEKANQRLIKLERDLNVQRAQSRAAIEGYKKTAEDVSRSEQERLAAARAASSLEQGLLARQIDLQKQRIANIKAEVALGQATTENLDRIAAAEVQLAEYQEDSLGKQTELQNKVNEIRISSAQNRISKEIALLEEQLQYATDTTERQEEGVTKIKQDAYKVRRALLDQQRAYELASVVAGSNQEAAILAKYRAQEAQLDIEQAAELSEREYRIALDEINARLVAEAEGTAERLRIGLEAIDKQAEADKDAAGRAITNQEELNARLRAIDAKAADDKATARQQIRDAEIKVADDLLAYRLAQVKEGSRDEYRLQLAQLELRKQAAIENEQLTQAERLRIIAEADRQEANLRRKRLADTANQIINSVEGATGVFSKLIESQVNNAAKALEKQQAAALAAAGLSADQRAAIEKKYQKEKEKLEREAATKRKRIAIVEAIIDVARSVVAASIAPPPFNIIGAALAAATGAAQIAVIESQQFARGGYVSGPGTGSSDSITARISNGESVMTAKATERFYPLLSWMNQAGGGRAFPGTAQIAADAAPGLLSGYAGGGVPSLSIDYDLLADKIGRRVGEANRELPPPVADLNEFASGMRRLQARESANDWG